MAHGSVLSVNLLTADADAQAWVNAMHAAIAASGMVQTSDTGQMASPYTGAKPTGTLATMGYEIWRMNDTQQANFPIYLKIEYGSNNSAATGAAWFITIGTGTNGAGTITGTLLARTNMARNGTPPAGTFEQVASAGEGYFCMCQGLGALNWAGFFCLQRHIDVNGDPTDDAIFVYFPSTTNVNWHTLMKQPGGLLIGRQSGASGVGPPVLYNPENTNASEVVSLGGEVPLYPFEPFLGRRQAPLLGSCVVHADDVGAGVVFTATMFGSTKTWRRVSDASNAHTRGGSSVASTSKTALALRWET